MLSILVTLNIVLTSIMGLPPMNDASDYYAELTINHVVVTIYEDSTTSVRGADHDTPKTPIVCLQHGDMVACPLQPDNNYYTPNSYVVCPMVWVGSPDSRCFFIQL